MKRRKNNLQTKKTFTKKKMCLVKKAIETVERNLKNQMRRRRKEEEEEEEEEAEEEEEDEKLQQHWAW